MVSGAIDRNMLTSHASHTDKHGPWQVLLVLDDAQAPDLGDDAVMLEG